LSLFLGYSVGFEVITLREQGYDIDGWNLLIELGIVRINIQKGMIDEV